MKHKRLCLQRCLTTSNLQKHSSLKPLIQQTSIETPTATRSVCFIVELNQVHCAFQRHLIHSGLSLTWSKSSEESRWLLFWCVWDCPGTAVWGINNTHTHTHSTHLIHTHAHNTLLEWLTDGCEIQNDRESLWVFFFFKAKPQGQGKRKIHWKERDRDCPTSVRKIRFDLNSWQILGEKLI